jgi:cytochrome c oxidase subunit IV
MTDATIADTTAVDEHAADDHGGHASDLMYIKIAVLLAVMTAGEVAWPYIIDDGPVLMWPLLVVMALKFVVIAAFFMHLKFDSKVLTRVFYSGLFLAVGVYIAALCTFRIFDS